MPGRCPADSSRIAVWKAGEAGLDLKGSVVCSDAFFPFPDGLIGLPKRVRLQRFNLEGVYEMKK